MRVKIWEVQDILCQWVNLQEKIIPYVFGRMAEMCTYQLKIQEKFIV